MKKVITAIAALALSAACLTGCGKPKIELNTADVADGVLSSVTFTEYLEPIAQDIEVKRLGLDASKVEECSAYAGTKAVVDEIAVIKSSDAQEAQAQIEAYVASQKESYASYKPDEVTKLEDCVIKTVGDYVIYVASADNAAAQAVVDSLTTVE
ncbi:MAG: DUF4358 domain-containing protein [Clostridiales bacterium]|nr:DUF4358 domain-containing protein [Clostridiales bacterium]